MNILLTLVVALGLIYSIARQLAPLRVLVLIGDWKAGADGSFGFVLSDHLGALR